MLSFGCPGNANLSFVWLSGHLLLPSLNPKASSIPCKVHTPCQRQQRRAPCSFLAPGLLPTPSQHGACRQKSCRRNPRQVALSTTFLLYNGNLNPKYWISRHALKPWDNGDGKAGAGCKPAPCRPRQHPMFPISFFFLPWHISKVPLSQEAGACTSSPLTWGLYMTHPHRRWMIKKTQRGGCFPLSLSLSYEHCFSFNWFHSWRPFAKCNYARLSPSVCVQEEPSLSLFLSSIFISALIPALQLTCTTMSRTSWGHTGT